MGETEPMGHQDPARVQAEKLSEYFAEGRKRVRGFLTDGAAAAILMILRLQAKQDIKGQIAEIGTYYGKTFIGLALALRDEEQIIGLDIFTERETDFEADLRANYRSFGIPDKKVRLHRGSSSDLSRPQWQALLGGPARFIHVDGEHTRKAAFHDLTLSVASLAPGGVILVDDILHSWYPDVTLGLLDFLHQELDITAVALIDRQGPLINGGAKMLLTRRADLARYRQAFIEQMRPYIVREAQFDQHRPLVLAFDHLRA